MCAAGSALQAAGAGDLAAAGQGHGECDGPGGLLAAAEPVAEFDGEGKQGGADGGGVEGVDGEAALGARAVGEVAGDDGAAVDALGTFVEQSSAAAAKDALDGRFREGGEDADGVDAERGQGAGLRVADAVQLPTGRGYRNASTSSRVAPTVRIPPGPASFDAIAASAQVEATPTFTSRP
ncbi:hypothetical protein SMICM17S_10167 [Streptomyces microflavus]